MSNLHPMCPEVSTILLMSKSTVYPMQTKSDAQAYLTRCRDHESDRRARLPEWVRRLEDLMLYVPESERLEGDMSLLLLVSAIGARAVIDPTKLASEATDVMRGIANRDPVSI